MNLKQQMIYIRLIMVNYKLIQDVCVLDKNFKCKKNWFIYWNNKKILEMFENDGNGKYGLLLK